MTSPDAHSPSRIRRRRAHAGRIGICLLGLVLISAALRFRPSGVDDFPPFYHAGSLAGSADLFAQSAFHAQSKMFLRTPFYALLLRPLGWLAYPGARLVWTGLMLAAFACSAWLWPGPRTKIVMAMCWAFPIVPALALGQDIALMMLLVAVAARLWIGGRQFAAGLVASLLALKVTFLLPVALVFLARSRRGFGGLAAGAAVQCALSLAIQGPAWIPEYLAALQSPLLDQVPARMPSVRAFVGGVPFAAAAAAIYGCLWWIARRVTPAQALTAALPLGVIAAPHCYVYDMAAAVPLLAIAASPRRAGGILAIMALSPVPYVLLAPENPSRAGAAILVAAVLASAMELLAERRAPPFRQTLPLQPAPQPLQPPFPSTTPTPV
jgi:Glycosyltransferase family 87